MRLTQRLSPLLVPPHLAGKGEIEILHDRILQRMLLLLSVFSLGQIISVVGPLIQSNRWVLIGLYCVLYVIVAGITFAREWPYKVRANIVTALMFLLAISELFESGLLGEVRMIMIVYIATVAILFNTRNTILSIALCLVTIAGAGIASTNPGVVASLPVLANIQSGTNWITSSIGFLLYSLVVAGSINMFIEGLEKNMTRQAELTKNLEKERNALEVRVQERTQNISRRMLQLRTASEITHSLSALADPDEMLHQNVELIRERLDLYYVGVFLLDSTGQNAVLQAGTGEAGRKMIADGHRLAVGGNSMIGWAISNRKARIALDVGTEAVRFSNPNLPLTRSELALPIIARDTVLGAMTVQSSVPNAFDDDDITVLQGIADSLGVALDNDHLFRTTRQALEDIRAANLERVQKSWAETIETYGDLSYDFENSSAAPLDENAEKIEVPLVLRDEVIGYVTLESDRQQLTKEEASFIENITNQTAIALENARLLEETERRAIQEKKLNELTASFSRALTIDEILRAAAVELGQLPSVAGVSVRMAPAGKSIQSTSDETAGHNGNGKEVSA